MRYIIIFAVLVSCTSPRLDGSNEEEFERSLSGIKNSLSEGKAAKVDSALKVIGLNEIQSTDNIFSQAISGNINKNIIRSLNNKTANEVIAIADSIRKSEYRKLKESAIKEIDRLEKLKEESHKAQNMLKGFVIEQSRIYFSESFFTDELVFELHIRNKTPYAVSKIEANASVFSAGRKIPWHKSDFNYEIDGGIEPDESKVLKLTPNMYSGWQDVPDRDDLLLNITIKNLYGANKGLITRSMFTPKDQARLEIFKDVYQN